MRFEVISIHGRMDKIDPIVLTGKPQARDFPSLFLLLSNFGNEIQKSL